MPMSSAGPMVTPAAQLVPVLGDWVPPETAETAAEAAPELDEVVSSSEDS